MRVLHRDPKTGEIKLRVENPDDLWHLHNLLLPGDLVRASTTRREEVKSDKVRPERGEKVRVTLTIRVEGVEFQAFSDRLRITGVIVEGPQDLGRHHTLNVGVEDVLSILKTWRAHELRRIEEAVGAGPKPLVPFLAPDDEEALIGQLRQYGVRELSTNRAPGHGKMFPSGDARTAFFDDILAQVRATEVGEALVLVGPGFTRGAFVEYLKARDPPLAAKVHVHGTAHAGMQGIQEALRAGVGAKVFGESRVGYETQLVEKLLEAIATDRPVAYGPAEVQEAADAGAIETLLVSDAVVRNPGIAELMRTAESARGTVVLVSRHHEAGKKLGVGKSERPRGTSLFTIERAVEEVEGVRKALGLGRIHLLGNSYGGMLALAYAIKYQRHLRSLVVASGLPSVPVANEELRRLVRTLPIRVQRTIERLEREEAFDDPAYARAAMAFYRRHICRLPTWPRELTRAMGELSQPVYRTMWGPSEFAVQGSLRY